MSTDLLPLYRAIRNSIDAIHDLAASIEGDVARHQIYREPDGIRRAIERMQGLTTTIDQLERQLLVCARLAPDTQARPLDEAGSPTRAAA
jgi:hypothetical protein